MHIPLSIGKLGDPRGIPVLLQLLSSVNTPDDPADDSDDDIFMSCGKDRLYSEAVIALANFKDDEVVRQTLQDGLQNPKISEACQAALYQITKDEQYLQPLIDKLNNGKSIDFTVQYHIVDHCPNDKFSEALKRKSDIEKELEEKKKLANEIGVECWEPSESDLEKFKSKKIIGMNNCKTQKLHPSLLTLEDITSVELCDNRLTELPIELSKFNLKKLNLQGNRLTGTLSEAIGLFTSLEELGFHGNKLEAIPDSIGQLTNLKKLTLSNNKLKSIPESIGNLINLTTLQIDRNEITSLPGSLCKLTLLDRLDFSYNKLTSLPDIGTLVNVESIFLQNNELTALPDLSTFNKLRLVNAEKNPLKQIPPIPTNAKIYSDMNKDD